MKIIFLDFDGVILTLRTAMANKGHGWSSAKPDEPLCKVLRVCCEKAGIRIVVSSTWRETEKKCKEKLAEAGLLEFLHADWSTPVHSGTGERPGEIQTWLHNHPEVTDYRILDDENWTWFHDQRARFLKCDGEDGASARVLIALLEWAGETNRTIELATQAETERWG